MNIFGKSYIGIWLTLVVISVFFFTLLIPLHDELKAGDSTLVTIEDTEAPAGQKATVPVKIENPGEITGGKVVISYDPEIAEISDGDINQGRALRGTTFMPNANYDDDKLALVWAATTPPGEEGILAEISFYLKEEGETALQFEEVSLSDEAGDSVEVDYEEGQLIATEREEEEVVDPEEEPPPEEEEAVAPDDPSLEVGEASGGVGETLQVSVKMLNPGNIAGGKITLAYNPEIVEPEGIENILPPEVFAEYNLDYSDNSLSLAWFGMSGELEDEQELAQIYFLLQEEGTSPLEFENINLIDIDGEDIAVETKDGEIVSGTPGITIPGWEDGWYYYAAALGVIMVLLVIFFILRKRQQPGEGEAKDEFDDFLNP